MKGAERPSVVTLPIIAPSRLRPAVNWRGEARIVDAAVAPPRECPRTPTLEVGK